MVPKSQELAEQVALDMAFQISWFTIVEIQRIILSPKKSNVLATKK